MTELTPFRFGVGPPPRPKPPKSWPQSMGQPGIGHQGPVNATGASVTMSGSTPTGAIGNPGASSAPPMHIAAVAAPVNQSPAANGAVPGATPGAVQRPAVSGMNGYPANPMPAVPGIPPSGLTAPPAPTLAQTAAPMPAPYEPTAHVQATNTSTTENASIAPIRGGRGIALSEEDKIMLLKVCVESQNTLKFSTKTAFWRRVSNRFENIRGGRQYSAGSCERAIGKWTDARRVALKNAGGRRVLSEAQRMTLLVDQMIDVQDEVEQKAKEKDAEMKEMFARLEAEVNGTTGLQTPTRMAGNQQGETQVSPSIFDHNTPRGSHNSDATSPEIDITDSNITTLPTTHNIDSHNNDHDPMDFESAAISELSRIRSLVTQEANFSVANTSYLKKNHESLNTKLDRLEDKFKEMQKTLDQQTGILSDQNTVLKQILTMMSHGRRSPLPPGPPFQGPPFQGPYYPPYQGPPYYAQYQGPPFPGPPPQGFPPPGPLSHGPQAQAQPQKTQPQGTQPQASQPPTTQAQNPQPQGSQTQGTQSQDNQSQGPQTQGTQPQDQAQGPPSQGSQALAQAQTQPQGPPPPPSGKFAVYSGWVS